MICPGAAARPGRRRQSCGAPHAGALNQKLNHVPFKDDQLTMLLRPSLSGGAQTYVLLAARPEGEHATETLQALPPSHLTILPTYRLTTLPSDLVLQALRFGETCASVEVAARGGAERQVQAALAAIDQQVAELEWAIRSKERFETHVVRRRDERAGLLDGHGPGAALTDLEFEEKKVSRIVGAEKERATLEKLLGARRALLGE